MEESLREKYESIITEQENRTQLYMALRLHRGRLLKHMAGKSVKSVVTNHRDPA